MDRGPTIMLVGLSVPILFCCGGGYFLMSSTVDSKATSAKKFGDEVVREVTTTEPWQSKMLLAKASKQYKSLYSAEQIQNSLLNGPSQALGKFSNGKSRVRIESQKSKRPMFEYENTASFSRGRARIVMKLQMDDSSSWQVESFKIEPE